MFDRMVPYFEDNYLAQGWITVVLPKVGRADETRAFYEDALKASERVYIMPAVLGMVAASIGDNDAAFQHFEDALAQNALVASWLRDPLIAGIQEDPRYAELMERIGLTP
jgi:hypothetical protein